MADTFATLATELTARGYDYLSSTRQGLFINRAYQLICDEYDWPFLETELLAQTAPVTISDLRSVLYVADANTGSELYGEDQRLISAADPGRTSTGSAECWYITGGNVLNVYPADTSASLTIRYIKAPADLSGSTEPLIPQRYRYLIVDMAVYLALRDNDEYDSALALKQLIDYEVSRMRDRLSVQNRQNPDSILATSSYPFPY
jgi:hypothetical protein